MTDNSPEYFERLARMIVRIADGALGRASYDGIEADERRLIEASSALRAAAALARENAELRETRTECERQYQTKVAEIYTLGDRIDYEVRRAESAESANLVLQVQLDEYESGGLLKRNCALQAEVDRLNRAIELLYNAYHAAFAYTGTEPQEKVTIVSSVSTRDLHNKGTVP